jgi:hypothetical protein
MRREEDEKTEDRRKMNNYSQHTTGTRQQFFVIWDLVPGISLEKNALEGTSLLPTY